MATVTCDNEASPRGGGTPPRALTHLSDLGGRGLGVSLPIEEQWRPVPGYEGLYEVSDQGRVRSLPRNFVRKDGRRYNREGRIRKVSWDSSGHAQVQLYRDDKADMQLVHRLVLRAFVGEPPTGLIGCHNDGDPSNNSVGNLRWDTHLSNNLDTVQHGRHRQAAQTHCKRGHEFTPDNTVQQNGARRCATCHSDWQQAHNAKRRAARRGLMVERDWPPYAGGAA